MIKFLTFYPARVLKFLKELVRLVIVCSNDNKDKKGVDSELRIATNGFFVTTDTWWYSLVEHISNKKVIVSCYKPHIIMSSCFGSYWLLRGILSVSDTPSLFFSGENLATLRKYREYKNYLNYKASCSMGFDYNSHPRYTRMPLWVVYLFSAEFVAKATEEDIRYKLDCWEKLAREGKTKFATMVASHAGYASSKKVSGKGERLLRTEIVESVTRIAKVQCPGRLLHNDDTLKDEYDDNKKEYLKNFRFNICAENASVKGYVTEKLFEAIEAGNIPIYWGDKDPESKILNNKRIIFWNKNDQKITLQKIKDLYEDPEIMNTFLSEPIFKDGASTEIHHLFLELREKVNLLLMPQH